MARGTQQDQGFQGCDSGFEGCERPGGGQSNDQILFLEENLKVIHY